jgi:hypothetical protein
MSKALPSLYRVSIPAAFWLFLSSFEITAGETPDSLETSDILHFQRFRRSRKIEKSYMAFKKHLFYLKKFL